MYVDIQLIDPISNSRYGNIPMRNSLHRSPPNPTPCRVRNLRPPREAGSGMEWSVVGWIPGWVAWIPGWVGWSVILWGYSHIGFMILDIYLYVYIYIYLYMYNRGTRAQDHTQDINAVLCCAIPCCVELLCCAVLCCAVLRCAALCCNVLCCALYFSSLLMTIQYDTINPF